MTRGQYGGKVQSVDIKGLFGHRNLSLNLDDEKITVFTGLNGAGKSHVLKLMYGTLEQDPEILERIEFQSVLLRTETGELSATKNDKGEISFAPERQSGKKRYVFGPPFAAQAHLGEGYNGISIVWGGRGQPRLTGGPILGEDDNQRSSMFIEAERLNIRLKSEESPELGDHLTSGIADVDPVEVYAAYIDYVVKEEKKRISRAQARQQRNLAKQLIDRIAGSGVSEDSLNEKYSNITAIAERSSRYGLMGVGDIQNASDAINSVKRGAPSLRKVFDLIYVNQLSIMSVTDRLVDRLEQLIQVLNECLSDSGKRVDYVPKRVNYDPIGKGRVIYSEFDQFGLKVCFDNGVPIPLRGLSSGEKQLISIFTLALLGTPVNGYLFIDEPEISMHPRWQKMFVPTLMELADAQGIQVFVATHSPIVLNGQWQLEQAVPMGSPPVAVEQADYDIEDEGDFFTEDFE